MWHHRDEGRVPIRRDARGAGGFVTLIHALILFFHTRRLKKREPAMEDRARLIASLDEHVSAMNDQYFLDDREPDPVPARLRGVKGYEDSWAGLLKICRFPYRGWRRARNGPCLHLRCPTLLSTSPRTPGRWLPRRSRRRFTKARRSIDSSPARTANLPWTSTLIPFASSVGRTSSTQSSIIERRLTSESISCCGRAKFRKSVISDVSSLISFNIASRVRCLSSREIGFRP